MKGLLVMLIFLVLLPFTGRGQYELQNFPAGCRIINMGSVPQTPENALKPYGLLYELLRDFKVEIKWIINPEKEKDGVDFIADSVAFRSGAFLIPSSYINDSMEVVLQDWKDQGVIIHANSAPLDLPVFASLTIPPKWTLDQENGYIAVPFFKAAGIPSSAFGGSRSKDWKRPDELGICDDIFVLPHSTPHFDTHKNLYTWNRKYKGAIWAGCNAVSKLENLIGPMPGAEESTVGVVQLNFLSGGSAGAHWAGLVPYHKHRHGTPPYLEGHPEDPVAQYLGRPDQAHLNGSERIFFPKLKNRWRSGAKLLVFDTDTPDIPEVSYGEGVISIYGHAFDDPENGLVMYQSGHSIYGETEAHVAALRSFFNWSFYAAEIKRKENLITFQRWNSSEQTIGAKIGDDLTDVLNLAPINFDLDQYEIRKEVRPQLREIAAFMINNPAILLDIRSHTDSRANDRYNQELSNNRVRVTREFLIRKGVEPSRISGRGYGENELLNHCRNQVDCSEVQHEENRRSEFILSIDCSIYNALEKKGRIQGHED